MINEKKARFIHTIKGLKTQFINAFKEEPTDVFSSPGRIELLGNHTDHNHGKVLVSSVNLNILALTRKRDDGKVVYHAKGYRKINININDLSLKESEYGKSDGLIRGVLFKMKELWGFMNRQFPEQEKLIKKMVKANKIDEYERLAERLFEEV